MGQADRAGPLIVWLRALRDDQVPEEPIEVTLARLEAEVRSLEQAAQQRPHRERIAPTTVRRALTFLRDFGHLASLDLASVPPPLRPFVVRFLALEYRGAFARAGTTQHALREVTGRSGAR